MKLSIYCAVAVFRTRIPFDQFHLTLRCVST